MKLNYEQIRMDGGTQPRSKLMIEVMEDYAEQMRAGVEFPPITVFFDGKDYWLADGFHRLGAALRARPADPIEADVIRGTQTEAQWYSFGVNQTHGLRRMREDAVRAVKAAIRHSEGANRSDNDIAKHVGVSPSTVAKYRGEIESTFQIGKSSGQTSKDKKDDPDKAKPDHELLPWERPATQPARRPRTGRDGRTINTANIGKRSPTKKGKKNPKRISASAATPVLGHSLPNPMIGLNLPPGNPVMAAATIFKLFDANFVRALIAELTLRLKGMDNDNDEPTE